MRGCRSSLDGVCVCVCVYPPSKNDFWCDGAQGCRSLHITMSQQGKRRPPTGREEEREEEGRGG